MKHLTIILTLFTSSIFGQSVFSGFYMTNIPTSFSNPPIHDAGCNGATTTLEVTLPAGTDKQVTKVTVTYNMTASFMFFANKSDQRSKIYCQNSAMEESDWAVGVGGVGTQVYSRDINIANGSYPGGTTLTFEMRAVRTDEILAGCNNEVNRVDAGTWQIEVHYQEINTPISKVGVNEANPKATLDVNGKLKVSDDTEAPIAGAIRYNSATLDFEGFDGTQWKSFTKSNGQSGGGWGKVNPNHENQRVVANDPLTSGYFGKSVAIDGDYTIIGSYGANTNQGAAYIFIKDGDNNWVQQAKLTASDGQAGDVFGLSVSISGEYAVVGAMLDDTGANIDHGAAYIFKRSGVSWTQQAKLTATDLSAQAHFGSHVSIHGDYIVVGAYQKSEGIVLAKGAAYIYLRTGVTWAEQAKLSNDSVESFEYFGWGVSIFNNYVAIGAYNNDENGNNAGAAYIFVRSGNSWAQQAKLLASDGAMGDEFGNSIALHGDHVVVGARKDDDRGQNSGSAYVFKRNGSTWVQQAKLVASDGSADDEFGTSVSIYGDDIVVGSPRDNLGSNFPKGSAYIYSRNGSSWNQQAKLGITKVIFDVGFLGDSVAISDSHVVVSNFVDDGDFLQQGAVYFYHK